MYFLTLYSAFLNPANMKQREKFSFVRMSVPVIELGNKINIKECLTRVKISVGEGTYTSI